MNTNKSSPTICFTWSGTNKSGNKVSGEILAKNKLYGTVYLKGQGITALVIRKKRHYFAEKIYAVDVALFLRQLGTLTSAGIPLAQACSTLETSHQNSAVKSLITAIRTEIENGLAFSAQLQKFPRYFDTFICELIKLGEKTGKFDHVLLQAAAYKEKNLALKKQIKQALLYPAIISSVAMSVTFIMLIFILPRFTVLFDSAHQELPAFTRFVLNISLCIKKYYYLGIIPLLSLISFWYALKKSSLLQKKIDRWILKVPIFGKMINKTLLARLARNLALTYSTGMPIIDSLKMLSLNSGNSAHIQSIHQLHVAIDSGLPIHTAMQQIPLFPTLLIQMVKIGEESGKLETMLEKMALFYEQELECFINNQKQLLEPLIIIILGVLIGGLVVAMYLPVFKLGTTI